MSTFAGSGLIALAAVSLIGTLLLSRTASREAVRDARAQASLAGRGIVEDRLEAAWWRGDPAARAQLDRVVRRNVLTDGVVRVKIWAPDGTIVYSDERRLEGRRYPLGREERETLADGGVDGELSDLDEPENRFERRYGKLLEVYVRIRTPAGRPLLFESYKRFSSVSAGGRRIWAQFLPSLVVGLVLLGVAQLPLAWRMARRLRDGQRHRELLLRRALAASDEERRRIAGSLHDGVVQDLAGLSYGLSATADRLARSGAAEPAAALDDAARRTRQGIRAVRTALVDVYPPDLRRSGLGATLDDLASSLGEHRVAARVEVAPEARLDAEHELVVFRVAQEALRNVGKHAGAEHVDVVVARDGPSVVLTVRDDGHGFVAQPGAPAGQDGHLGLMLLRDLAAGVGGSFDVASAAGRGTTVRLEVPAR